MPQAIPVIVKVGASFLVNAGVAKSAAFFISSAVVSTALSAASSAVLSALMPKPDTPTLEDPGFQLRTRSSSREPRSVIYGETLVGGHLAFERTGGTDRKDLYRIYAIGEGGEYDSIQEVRFGDETLTLDGSGNVTTPSRYDGFATVLTALGSETQAAMTEAVTDITEWTTDHRGRGICYAYVKLVYDGDAFSSGLPNVFFKVRGRKVYDPRLDSTNGGSGSHRKDDPTTWAWTQNPALWVLDYMRGVKMNGVLIAGLGLPDALIDWTAFADAADACDESVSVVGGGTIDRYTGGGGLVTSADNPVGVIQAFVNTIAGELVPRSGHVALYAGEARTATVTLSDDDLAGPISLKTAKSIRETVNSMQAGYREPDEGYEMVDAPAYSKAAWVTDDGDTFSRSIPLPWVNDHRQAQRISKIIASRGREPRILRGTFKQKALQVREGDAFTWSSDRFPSGVTGKYICINRNANSDGTVDITARSEDDAKYSWDAATEEQTRVSTGDIAEPTTTTAPELTDGRITSALDSSGDIRAGTQIEQSSGGAKRELPFGMGFLQLEDGDAVTFATAYDSPPSVHFPLGQGKIHDTGTLTGDQYSSLQALSLTTSGFTMRAKLEQLASSTTTTDGITTTGGTYSYEGDKSTTNDAVDSNYEFGGTVQLTLAAFALGTVTIDLYTNDGGGFVKRASRVFNFEATSAGTYSEAFTEIVSVASIGQGGHKEWAIDIAAFTGGTSPAVAAGQVVYEAGVSAANVPATTSSRKVLAWVGAVPEPIE